MTSFYGTIAALAGLLLFCSCSTPPREKADSYELFNGNNLEGWSHFLVDGTLSKEDVWSVRDGLLVCKGKPTGYLYTDKTFQDFMLELDWRWAPGEEPGNSGVLLRIAGDAVSFLPRCVEAQLQHGNAGDIWAFYGAAAEGDPGRTRVIKDHKDLGTFAGVGKIQAAERAPGEWNRYTITLLGGNLQLRVNGELVNEADGLDVLPGPIGLQSEGAEIHFRNIRLTKLQP